MAVAKIHLAVAVRHIIAPLAVILTAVAEVHMPVGKLSRGIVTVEDVSARQRLLAVTLILVIHPLAVVVGLIAERKLALAVPHTVLEIALIALSGIVLIVGELASAVRNSVFPLTDKVPLRKIDFHIRRDIAILLLHLEAAFDA